MQLTFILWDIMSIFHPPPPKNDLRKTKKVFLCSIVSSSAVSTSNSDHG